jgi:energy-coupling factor transport system substrate-specific component
MTMFQATGVHGPELTPLGSALLNLLLVSAAFAFLFSGRRSQRFVFGALATLVVSMAALRVVMQPLPNVQPVTVAAVLVGAHFGARRGAAFAVLVALLSNMLIGDGWWTLFQAAGWASAAFLGALFVSAKSEVIDMRRLCYVSIASAFLFGLITTLSLVEAGTSVTGFGLLFLQGAPYDAVHAVGNLMFAVWLGPLLHGFLQGLTALNDEVQHAGDAHVVHG